MSFAELTSYDYELCVNSVRGGEYNYNATEGNLQGSTNPCEFLYVILPEAYSGYSAYCTENCFIGRTLEFTFLICLATTEGGEFDINFHMSSVEGMTKLKSTETLPSFYYCPQISSIVDCEVNVTTYEDHSTVNFQAETSECQATMCHTTEFFNNLRTPPIQNNCVCDAYPGTTCIFYPSHGSYLNFTADVYF